MSLFKDLCRVGPAPTLRREVAVFTISLVVLGGLVLHAISGEPNRKLLIMCGVLALYLVGRLVFRVLKPAKPDLTTNRRPR